MPKKIINPYYQVGKKYKSPYGTLEDIEQKNFILFRSLLNRDLIFKVMKIM